MGSLPRRAFRDHAREDIFYVTETFWTLSELEFYDSLQRVWAQAYLKKHKNDNDELKKKYEEFIQEEKDIKKKKDKSFEYKDRLAALVAYKNASLERHSRWFQAWHQAKRGEGPEPKEYRETDEYHHILKAERANREKEEQYLRELILARDRDPETGRLLPPQGVKQTIKRTFGWGRKPDIVVSDLVSDLVDKAHEEIAQLSNTGGSGGGGGAPSFTTAGSGSRSPGGGTSSRSQQVGHQLSPSKTPDQTSPTSSDGSDNSKEKNKEKKADRERDKKAEKEKEKEKKMMEKHKCSFNHPDADNCPCVEDLRLKAEKSAESLGKRGRK